MNWADVDDSEPESSGAQASVPCANLGTRVLRSSRHEEQDTELKKASQMPANDSGKHNMVVMQEANDPYDSHSSSELQRKVAKLVGPIDARMEVGLDTLDRDHNLSG